MKDRFDLAETAALQSLQELGLVEVVGDSAIDQVAELATVAQIVDDYDVVATATIELANQIAANEPGPAGDDDHGGRRPASELRPRPGDTSSCSRGISPRPWPRSANRPSDGSSTDTCSAMGNAAAGPLA